MSFPTTDGGALAEEDVEPTETTAENGLACAGWGGAAAAGCPGCGASFGFRSVNRFTTGLPSQSKVMESWSKATTLNSPILSPTA